MNIIINPDSLIIKDLLKYNRYGCDGAPSTGNVNCLVIPVKFTDGSFPSGALSDLEKCFNGTESDTGWESVKSYFYKSSYGALNLNFEIAPEYNSGYNSSYAADEDYNYDTTIMNSAVEWYRTNYSTNKCKEFDADGNGYIDCVFMIYSTPNDTLWAYTYWGNKNSNTTNPTANAYIYSSYDFMYSNDNGGGSPYIDIDAHTYIHEFGHAMGLNDYYNYDKTSKVAPAGAFDMQDWNVGDHNPFSKMAFNWAKPYVVYDDCSITITSSALNKNQYIMIPAGGYDNWNKSPFDEYLVLELYTAEGVNYFDSHNNTYNDYNTGTTMTGIRLYHIDSRVYRFSSSGYITSNSCYVDSITSGYTYDVAASNTTKGADKGYFTDVTEAQNFYQVHLLSQDGTDRTVAGKKFSSVDLFLANDEFSMSSFSSYFYNEGKMNDGSTLGFSFKVTSLSNSQATITFTKL